MISLEKKQNKEEISLKGIISQEIFKNKEKFKINLNDNVLVIDFQFKEMEDIRKKISIQYESENISLKKV